MTDLSKPSDARWHVLGALRFLLAVVVVSSHLAWFQNTDGLLTVLSNLGATSAVLGFLLVSGYSIGHSLEKRPVGFYRRRVLRIYPMYGLAILYTLLPFYSGADALRAPHMEWSRPHGWLVVGNLVMLQNLVCLPMDANSPVWTLGIEVICYLFAPALRKLPSQWLIVLIGLSAGAFACYPHTGWPHYSQLRYGIPLLLFVWAWIAGFLLQRFRNSAWIGLSIAALGIILLKLNSAYAQPLSIATLAGAGLLVTFAPKIPVPRAMRWMLDYLGDLSYPLYLFHLPTFLLGYAILNVANPFGLLVMAFLVSAVLLLLESTLRPLFVRKSAAPIAR